MVIGLGGAVTDAMVDDVAGRFGGLEAVATPAPPVTVLPVISGPTVRIERRDSDQAHLILSVGGYPVGHADRYVLSVLQAVLGGGMSSRLFTEVRERRGLAYYVFASHAGYTDTGSLYVQAGVDTKRIELAVETIWSELRRMATEPVPEGRDRQGEALHHRPHRARRRGCPRHDPARSPAGADRGRTGRAGGDLRGHRGRHRGRRGPRGGRPDPARQGRARGDRRRSTRATACGRRSASD